MLTVYLAEDSQTLQTERRSQELFYLLKPLNNLTPGTLAHTYQASGFGKAPEQGPQVLHVGDREGRKVEKKRTG